MTEEIIKICEDVCMAEISKEDELIAMGMLDSFKIIELVNSLEDKFNIKFSPEEISNMDIFCCVKNIVNFVNDKLSK